MQKKQCRQDQIKPVNIQLIKPKDIPNQQPPTTPFSANSSVSDSGVFSNNFFNDDDHTVESQAPNQQCARFIIEKALEVDNHRFYLIDWEQSPARKLQKEQYLLAKYTIKLPKLKKRS